MHRVEEVLDGPDFLDHLNVPAARTVLDLLEELEDADGIIADASWRRQFCGNVMISSRIRLPAEFSPRRRSVRSWQG